MRRLCRQKVSIDPGFHCTSGYYYHIVTSSEQYMRDAWKDAGFTQGEIELMVELAKEYTPEQ